MEFTLRTISLGDTGAFRASEISCTFALTLPFRVRMVRNASLKLFCLVCPLPPELACPFAHDRPGALLSLLGTQRSTGGGPPFAYPFSFVGLGRYGDCPSRTSKTGNCSIDVRIVGLVSPLGNLKLGIRLKDAALVE